MAADVTGLLMIPKKKGEKPAYGGGDDAAAEDSGPPVPSDEPSMGSAKTMAAEDAMAAFESGDAAALSDALTRHYEACASGEE